MYVTLSVLPHCAPKVCISAVREITSPRVSRLFCKFAYLKEKYKWHNFNFFWSFQLSRLRVRLLQTSQQKTCFAYTLFFVVSSAAAGQFLVCTKLSSAQDNLSLKPFQVSFKYYTNYLVLNILILLLNELKHYNCLKHEFLYIFLSPNIFLVTANQLVAKSVHLVQLLHFFCIFSLGGLPGMC